MDKTFISDFTRRIALVAEIAHPFIIQFEDDFELSNHPLIPCDACYCPLHLAALSKRLGRTISASRLLAMFKRPTKANQPVREAFVKVCRDSVVTLA